MAGSMYSVSWVRRAACAGVLVAAGCAKQSPKPEAVPLDPNLAQYVLDEVPNDLKNPTFIDFEGKVQIIGWELDQTGVVGPGQKFKLKLYWRSSRALGPGFSLFTHFVAPGGLRVDANIGGVSMDDMGPLRSRSGVGSAQALGPSAWQPGKIYVDEQELEMPRQVNVPEVSVVVGVWKGVNRLDVISGPADRERRAIVTHVKTGVAPPPPPRRKQGPPQQKS
jgi:hypothetical protein